MPPQSIVWDPVKARINREKHGVDFQDAATIFLDPLLLVQPDLEHSQKEDRWIAIGRSMKDLLLVVIHTGNDRTIRIISARKATPKERRGYERFD